MFFHCKKNVIQRKCRQNVRVTCSNVGKDSNRSHFKNYKYGSVPFFLILDIDECSAVSHNCHGVANCHNTIGSFTCSCRSDYTGDGLVCEPIGEEL